MNQIEETIRQLESDVLEIKQSLVRWDTDSKNFDGSRKYRGAAKRIVLQAQKLEELVKANTFQR